MGVLQCNVKAFLRRVVGRFEFAALGQDRTFRLKRATGNLRLLSARKPNGKELLTLLSRGLLRNE